MSSNGSDNEGQTEAEANEKNVDFTFGAIRYGEARFGAQEQIAIDAPDSDAEAIFGETRFGRTRFGDVAPESGDPWTRGDGWKDRILGLWQNRGVILHRGTNLWMLLRSMLAELDRLTESAEALQQQFWIDTASGQSLDYIGVLIGVNRRTNEVDETYRERIRGALAASTSTTTHDVVVQIMSRILRCDPTDIRIERISEGTIDIHVDQNVINNSPLSEAEIIDFGNRMVPAGHRVGVGDSEAFLLKSEDGEDDPKHGFTGPNTAEGGYLG